jgi:argininosuccinate synthase
MTKKEDDRRMSKKKVVLAYSGGLDTSVAVHWMTQNWGVEVIALAVEVGQGIDADQLVRRAKSAGALAAEVIDAREELANDYVTKALAANALYEGRYPLVSALSRPLIVWHLVEAAKRYKASAIAHGCTGKGNDQVRFEVGAACLAPDLEQLAPVRQWGMTRAQTIEYAAKAGIEIEASLDKPYSIDENLWGRAIECGVLEDPWAAPPEDIFTLTKVRSTDEIEVTIGFEAGKPVSLQGEAMSTARLIANLDELAGSRGFGRIDMVESRRVGIKSREVYECPGALALLRAHQDLEGLTLERDVLHEKRRLEPKWAELAYDGLWFSPLSHALNAFMAETQKHVTGEVRLSLGPGRCEVTGRSSPVGLYEESLATYGAGDSFHHEDAAGFVRIFGLSTKTWAAKQGGAQ